jgi:hypothetical protein
MTVLLSIFGYALGSGKQRSIRRTGMKPSSRVTSEKMAIPGGAALSA